jgi:hypothetical protein
VCSVCTGNWCIFVICCVFGVHRELVRICLLHVKTDIPGITFSKLIVT